MRGKLKHTHGIENVLQSAVWHVLKLVQRESTRNSQGQVGRRQVEYSRGCLHCPISAWIFFTISAPGEGCRKKITDANLAFVESFWDWLWDLATFQKRGLLSGSAQTNELQSTAGSACLFLDYPSLILKQTPEKSAEFCCVKLDQQLFERKLFLIVMSRSINWRVRVSFSYLPSSSGISCFKRITHAWNCISFSGKKSRTSN